LGLGQAQTSGTKEKGLTLFVSYKKLIIHKSVVNNLFNIVTKLIKLKVSVN